VLRGVVGELRCRFRWFADDHNCASFCNVSIDSTGGREVGTADNNEQPAAPFGFTAPWAVKTSGAGSLRLVL